MAEHTYKFETLQLHVGQEQADPATDSRAVPIYQTTSYVFHSAQHAADRFNLRDAGNIYGRLTNSTQGVLEERVAALEGGVAGLAVAAGAAAVTYSVLALAHAGENIVAQKTIYGGSYNLLDQTLPSYGIHTKFVDAHNLAEVEAAIDDKTRAVFIETLGNPNSDIPDIDALAEIAHKNGLPLVIDNTFGTPFMIRPIEHGADVVIHSATKFIGGHGSTLGGIIVDGGKFDWAASGKFPQFTEPNASYHGVSFVQAAGPAAFVTYVRAILLRDTGACIAPISAWILLQGLETRPCPCVWKGTRKIQQRSWNIWLPTPMWKRSIILPCRIIPTTPCTRNISPTAALPSLPLILRAERTKHISSLIILRSSPCWPM